jgi:hypothetical protein
MRRFFGALSLVCCTILVNTLPCAFAQDGWSSLRVCNKGKVPIEVVVAHTTWNGQDLARGSLQGHWEVEGLHFKPGLCWQAYNGQGSRQEALIGFGFKD